MNLEVLDSKKKKIFKALSLFEGFYLAGGTALALQIGHRISVDFDLFSAKEISASLLPAAENSFGKLEVRVAVNNREELSLFVEETKVTFLYYPFPVLLNLVISDGMSLLSPKEIGVTKAYTIGRRGSYKDYIDLFFLIRDGHVTLEEIISLGEKKYGDAFNARLFLEQIVYLDDIEDTEIIFLKEKVDKKEVAEFFTDAVSKIKL